MQANLLLMHVIACDRTFLLAHPEENLSAKQFDRYLDLITRRAQGHPLQYLTGRQEFFQLDFEVTPDVLIPRPETELIVEVGIEILNETAAPLFRRPWHWLGGNRDFSASGIATGAGHRR